MSKMWCCIQVRVRFLSLSLSLSLLQHTNIHGTGTANVASSLLETATNRIQCSDVRHVTIRNLSIVKTHIRIEGPSASASSFLIRPRHLVLEAKSSERITVTRVQSRVSSCRANYVLKNMDGGNSLKLEVVSAIETSSSNSKTQTSTKEENDMTYQDNDKNSNSKTVSGSSPTTYPAVNIDMGHVTGDYPLCSIHRLASSLELSWDEERTFSVSRFRHFHHSTQWNITSNAHSNHSKDLQHPTHRYGSSYLCCGHHVK